VTYSHDLYIESQTTFSADSVTQATPTVEMPSSITLTVSHLPTSTSFFLSALQPLDYVYRGRVDETVGFGSATNPSAPADFWITQEIPGVPAGAAHIAFNAPSKLAVQHFFSAALKAGGKFHGDPAVRDSSGYYSAAVIDFDGNSIEAVYRPTFSDDKENDVKSVISNAKSTVTARSDAKTTVSRAAPTEVKSTVSRAAIPTGAPIPSQAKPSGDVIETFMAEARNAANIAREVVERARPSMNTTSSGGSGDTIMGTLLGVAAGAALTYAFTNRNSNNNDSSPPGPSASARSVTEPVPIQYQTYRVIEAAPSYYSSSPRSITLEDHEIASTVKPAKSHHTRRNSGSITIVSKSSRGGGLRMIEAPPPPSASTHISSSSSRHDASISDPLPAVTSYVRSHQSEVKSNHSATTAIRTTEQVVQRVSSRSPTSVASKSHASPSRASTVLKEPKEYPLPPSRAGTWAGESMASKAKSRSGESRLSKATKSSSKSKAKESIFDEEVTPDDSISQISVKTGTTVKGSKR
jgi:hypothetical protein